MAIQELHYDCSNESRKQRVEQTEKRRRIIIIIFFSWRTSELAKK
jgi:hypothetical protein